MLNKNFDDIYFFNHDKFNSNNLEILLIEHNDFNKKSKIYCNINFNMLLLMGSRGNGDILKRLKRRPC